jgi:hypothetical protein
MDHTVKENNYPIHWVTDHLATGPAPMSYDYLDGLKAAGIDVIMNLCAEFCDLHDIQSAHGFEVYYLPIEDEETPQLQALNEALDWLDEAIYLDKKVYVHCRHGIGRTGTVISAYLLRRGLGSKLVKRKLKKMRARPANFYQWRMVRKIGKKEGMLTIREPSLEWKHLVDLSPFFADYEALISEIDNRMELSGIHARCGADHARCCTAYVEVSLIEAAYMTHDLNKKLPSAERQAAILRCAEPTRSVRELRSLSEDRREDISRLYAERRILCPLSQAGRCLLPASRPLACRFFDLPDAQDSLDFAALCRNRTEELSRALFLSLAGRFANRARISFPLLEVVSGRFVQSFFHLLSSGAAERNRLSEGVTGSAGDA